MLTCAETGKLLLWFPNKSLDCVPPRSDSNVRSRIVNVEVEHINDTGRMLGADLFGE